MNQVESEERKRRYHLHHQKLIGAVVALEEKMKEAKTKKDSNTPSRYDNVYYEGLAWLDSLE